LEAVTIASVDENRRPIPGTQQRVDCDLLLLSVGLIPENELSRSAGLVIDPVTGGPRVNQHRETEIPGIYACGNVLHVHDLVDYVTLEGQLAGKGAAESLNFQFSILNSQLPPIATEGKNGVRYVVPQRIERGGGEAVKLYFRVGEPRKNAVVRLRCGDRVLLERKRPRLAPGEMEDITVTPEQLAGLPAGAALTVELD
ncbi:MAG: NAD(P)/FAD-dependent oxidoreductase, partial [Oscillospiraceae bacterium]|nr:NAD(P)/FAD-dependent oxidoreductase [Oscillospiraceae bacterium]